MSDLPTKPAIGLEPMADAATPVGAGPVEAVAEAIARALGGASLGSLYPGPRSRIEDDAQAAVTCLRELGWESPEDVALLHAIKDQFARQARDAQRETAEVRVRLDDQKAFAEGVMAAADSLRATAAALREQVADVLALCREIRPDSVLGTSPAVRLKLIEDRLTVVTNPKPAESVQEVAK
jgi:hypothetical protein